MAKLSFKPPTIQVKRDSFDEPERMFSLFSDFARVVKIMYVDIAKAINAVYAPEAWITPTLLNGWVTYSATFNIEGYYKDASGVVHLRGLIKNGTTASGVVLFTLPSGYRPPKQELIPTVTNSNVLARIDIKASGDVIATGANTGWLSLDGITFRAA